MAKTINTGAFAPNVEAPQADPSAVAGLSPELLQQIAAQGISPEMLMSQLQAMQQGATQDVAPVVDPLQPFDNLPQVNSTPQDSNVVPISPFMDPAGLDQPVDAPQPSAFNPQEVSSGQRMLVGQGRQGTTPEVQQGQQEQFQIEEEMRAQGAVGFKQRTRQQFEEAYEGYLMPGTTGVLYRTAKDVANAGIQGRYKIKDPQAILPASVTPVELVAKAFKTSPVEAVNATTFAFVNISSALSERQTDIDNVVDATDSDSLSTLGFLAGDTSIDEAGRVIISAETLDGILAGYTKSSLARVRAVDVDSLDQPALVGNSQAQMLKGAGLLEELFYQPKDPEGNIIDPKAAPVRGYQISEMGANASYSLREISDKNTTLNKPLPRRKAVKVHGQKPGTSIGAFNLRKVKVDKAAGERTKKVTASYQYAEDYRQSPVRFNPTVLSSIDTMIKVYEQATKIKTSGGEITPDQERLLANIIKTIKLEPDMGADGLPIENGRSPSKVLKAKKDLAAAQQVDGFVKRHVNPHGNSNRLTNDTADVNEQESPRIHKGAMEGVPRSYVLTGLKRKSDSDSVISKAEWDSFTSFLKGNSKPSVEIERTAMLWALGSWILPGTRTNSDKYLIDNFKMSNLREFAKKGDLMKQFIENPGSITTDPAALSKFNEFMEADVSIDKGKVNGFITKSAILASDIVLALDNNTTDGPTNVAFSPVAPSMDQSSAGRTLMAFDTGDINTIEHVGLMYDPEESGTNMFPRGNPRAFFLRTIQARLGKPDAIRGLNALHQQAVASALTPRGNSPESYAEFADDLGKIPLMTADYGKSKHFMQGPAAKFLSKRPEIAALLDDVATDSGNYDSGVEILNAVISQGIGDVTSTWYARSLKSQAIGAALLGFNLRGELSDGSSIRVGVKEYSILDDSGYDFVGPDGQVTNTGMLSERKPNDSPKARSKASWDKDTKSYPKRRLGSAQVNAIGPVLAHLREVEVNALAHRATMERLQDPNVFFGNIHDNVFGDPLYMALMQSNITKAMKQVTTHDIQESITKAFVEDAMVPITRLKNRNESEVVIGSGAKDPSLSGWLEYLDELYSEFQENVLKGVDPRFQYLHDLQQEQLTDAYSGGNGIWRPLAKPGVVQHIGAMPLKDRQPSETVAMVVPVKSLERFINKHVLGPIKEGKEKKDRSTRDVRKVQELYDEYSKNGQGFMKVGR
jgi:hypothetical protein